jgi:dTDP-4-amino-4,6-dideoxygalactose transaminase
MMIPVSKVWYPNKQKFIGYIDKIYESGWLTNNGPLVQELEKRLEDYLGVKNLLCVANGTLALQMAYKLLELEGEIITTPFTYVATTGSIVAEGLTPVYSDIDPYELTLDPKKIESVITDKTSAVVPVHVFGNACRVSEICAVAKRHNLKVVFDASHAFGVNYENESVLNYGDISTLSFNAVKLFHTIEGGALVIHDDALYEKAKIMRQYGIAGDHGTESMLGINAKMNECEAAMGLCILDEIESVCNERRDSYLYYAEHLKGHVQMLQLNEKATFNYSYCPIILESVEEMQSIQNALLENGIKPRRYFYPSLDTLSYVEHRSVMTISRDITSRILALPLHSGVESKVSEVIIERLKKIR